jgi:riboflavin kinase/FMN adenylyltransferase
VHIFYFDEDIYHKHLKVSLFKYTRKEMKFSGIDALINQLHEDKNQISKILENINPSK